MNTAMTIIPEQFIFAHGDDLKTTSLKVSEAFGKRHADILRTIEKVLTQVSDSFGKRNFALTEYEQKNNLGLMTKFPMYNLTKDGFMFLVMGFTGKPAAAIKEAYINAFNVMYNKLFPRTQYGLKQLPPSPYISEAEASQFKKSLEQHCKGERQQYSLLYRKVYDYYGVTSYKHIPVGKLPEAARLIGIKLVAVKKPKLPPEQPPEPQLICMTPMELLAHDEQVANEAVKRVQGELVSEPIQHDSITINLAPLAENEPMKRMMITQHHSGLVQLWKTKPETVAEKKALVITELKNEGYVVIERERLKNLSIEKLNDFIKFV